MSAYVIIQCQDKGIANVIANKLLEQGIPPQFIEYLKGDEERTVNAIDWIMEHLEDVVLLREKEDWEDEE